MENELKMKMKLIIIFGVVLLLVVASVVFATDFTGDKVKEDKLKDKIVVDWKAKDNSTYNKNKDVTIKKIKENKGVITAEITVTGNQYIMITAAQ